MAGSIDTQPLRPARRPRWRAYLLLARISNTPTVWSNVLAASTVAGAAAGGPVLTPTTVLVVLAASLFYTGGMFLNDAFDAAIDRVQRPERPIPRGDAGLGEVFGVGAVCLVLGLALLPNSLSRLVGVALAAAILLYDYSHKSNPVAPIIMGACRALVYGVAAAAFDVVPTALVVGAIVMWVYVAGLTVVARMAGARARWLVPLLIAAISLVDAAFIVIAVPSNASLAAVAALGFPLTLLLQRWVPGD
jgi:4-hydroxybenzoate polyprenyltransferase